MRAKFVVRLLDAADELISWAAVEADAKPQERGASCPFFAVALTQFRIERDGAVSKVTIHWPDLDVARMTTLPEPLPVTKDQVYDYTWIEPVWLVQGMRDVPLPAVTVRQSLTIGVPPGSLGMVGSGA